MDKPLKILVIGAVIAAGLAAFGATRNEINDTRHEHNIASMESMSTALQARCLAESDEIMKSGKVVGYNSLVFVKSGKGWGFDPLLCDPVGLLGMSGLVGVQKEIAENENTLSVERQNYPTELPYLIALGVLLIAALPWTWYFLLRRIRELSDAVRGQ